MPRQLVLRRPLLCLAITVLIVPLMQAAPASQKADSRISPAAQEQLQAIRHAYTRLKSLELAGTVRLALDVGGQQAKQQAQFTSWFQAPNMFRHDMQQDMQVGSTGKDLYFYNIKQNQYMTAQAPIGRLPLGQLHEDMAAVLNQQNLSLLLAISQDAAAQLTAGITELDLAEDTTIDGQSFTTLAARGPRGPVRFLIDPQTHLLRRMVADVSKMLIDRGAADVKLAELILDYTTILPDAPINPQQFAWSPPAAAKAAKPSLVGNPAPPFKLKTLDGKDLALADLKGSVVVLDFWATWCGPCRISLPKLDAIYQQLSEKGLKVYAINLREDKQKIEAFINTTHLSLPVLLSGDDVDEKYQVESIPTTVLVGKDGLVKKVFVGAAPNTEAQLRSAIDDAMKQ